MRRPLFSFAAAAVVFALSGSARAQAPGGEIRAVTAVKPPSPIAVACPAQPLATRPPAAGEKLKFNLDVYGAEMGSLEIWLEAPAREDRGKVALVAHARAKTSAFVTTNVGPYSTYATSKIGPGLAPMFAREEVDDSGTHWLTELKFPSADGKLLVKMSKDGEPQPLNLAASPGARDLLSTFVALRALLLDAGSPICFEVYAGRHLWKMSGSAAARETLETPLGKFPTIRLDFTSIRLDDPRIVRTTHFWLSDDPRRLPLAAIAEIKGKVIRAQLVSASSKGWSLGSQ